MDDGGSPGNLKKICFRKLKDYRRATYVYIYAQGTVKTGLVV